MLEAFTGLGSAAQPPGMQATTRARSLAGQLLRKQAALWTRTLSAGAGNELLPVVDADRGDRRFHGEQWSSHPWFNLLEAELPAQFAVARQRGRGRRAGPAAEAQAALLLAPVHRRDEPGQLRARRIRTSSMRCCESKGETVQAGMANLLEDIRARPHLDHRRDRLRGRHATWPRPRARSSSRTSCCS